MSHPLKKEKRITEEIRRRERSEESSKSVKVIREG